MKSPRVPWLRGLTVQLFAITVLPLTLLLLIIAFTSVFRHQQDMRALVGERDERAVQAAAAALAAELHHRESNISTLVTLAELSNKSLSVLTTDDLSSDFDGGLAYLSMDRRMLASTGNSGIWDTTLLSNVSLSASTDHQPLLSNPILDPKSKQIFIIVSEFSASRNMIVAGAFSPAKLANQTLSASYPNNQRVAIYLFDSSRQLLFANASASAQSLSPDYPGIAEALRGGSGTRYVKIGKDEHVVAYSPIAATKWILITEESWQ